MAKSNKPVPPAVPESKAPLKQSAAGNEMQIADSLGLEARLRSHGVFEGEDALLSFADVLDRSKEEKDAVEKKDKQMQLVTFILDDEEFGIPIQQVREIVRVTDITRVPQSPEHVRGVTNLRGKIIPVVDLKTRIGLTVAEVSDDSRILIVESFKRAIGFLVDQVSQVTRVSASNMDVAPEEVQNVKADYIRGVAKMENRLIILLDVERLTVLH